MTFMNWALTARRSEIRAVLERLSSVFRAEISLLMPVREALRALPLSSAPGPRGVKLPGSSCERSRAHLAILEKAEERESAAASAC